MKKLFPIILPLLFAACSNANSNQVKKSAELFFLYKARTDWQAFQDLYAADAVFEDVIFRYRYDKQEFISFYNWPDPLLKKHPDYPETMVLEDLMVNGNTAVGKGYFTPFYYGEMLYDDAMHMRFTIWLKFNEEGLITKHIDWIEYPPEFVINAMNRHMASDSISN